MLKFRELEARFDMVHSYPSVIRSLPEADVPVKGVKAWIAQCPNQQIIFFEMDAHAKIPEHSHSYPQWGFLMEGKMKLVIDGKARIVEKGDEYLIPARSKHSAEFLSKSRVVDFFSEETRYKPKSP